MTFPPSPQPFLNPKTFQCTKCGQCCRPIVKVSEEEIKRIELTGRKRQDFLAFDPKLEHPSKKDTLQQVNGVCTFLYRKGEEYFCSIYKHRPNTCKRYPFFPVAEKLTDCRPPRWQYWMDLKELVVEKE